MCWIEISQKKMIQLKYLILEKRGILVLRTLNALSAAFSGINNNLFLFCLKDIEKMS